MGPPGSKQWEKYNRELKILRAKQKAGGLLHAESQRLVWLEERLGEALEHSRIQVEEPVQSGPTSKTTEDPHATDVSQDLLEAAENFTPQKEWERDAPKPEAKFEASDPRTGQATFQQKGLSSFAVELTEDLLDHGFDEESHQDQESIGEATTHRIDETENLLDVNLVREALQYAEQHNLVDDTKDANSYSVDENNTTNHHRLAEHKVEQTNAYDQHLDKDEDELDLLDSDEFESIEVSEDQSFESLASPPGLSTDPIEPALSELEPEPLGIEDPEQIPTLLTDYHADQETYPPDRREDEGLPSLDDDSSDDSVEFEVPLWIEPESAGEQNPVDIQAQDREPTQPSPAPFESEAIADHREQADPQVDSFDRLHQDDANDNLPALDPNPSDKTSREPFSPAPSNLEASTGGSQRSSEELMANLFDDSPAIPTNRSAFDDLFSERPAQDQPGPNIHDSETTDIVRRRKSAGKENRFQGSRRVTVHFIDGVNRRGTMREFDPTAATFQLDPKPNTDAPAERFEALALKAIFVMLPRGSSFPPKQGKLCTITMVDGRKLEGYTNDYDPSRYAFTLLPKTDRGNIERVLVFLHAIKNIYFD